MDMAKDQKDFFKGKHPWSATKDDLLSCYLTPFFTKTYGYSRNGIVYVDAFAGEGLFDDGSAGSPVIAMRKLLTAAKKQRTKIPVQFIFAEANQDARQRLEAASARTKGNVNYIRRPIILESFEKAVNAARAATIRIGCTPSTYFFYIDPFGVKDLRMDLLLGSPNPQHTEVLLNFNTIGFIRDACAALKSALTVPDDVEVLNDSLGSNLSTNERIERLTSCVGSGEWIDVIRSKQGGDADFWEVEYQIAQLFCKNAASGYRYVTNMPIKDMEHGPYGKGLLKYRMVHMTNNADGCVLMNDNMVKRNDLNQTAQAGLFRVDVDGRDVEQGAIQEAMRQSVESLPIGKYVKMGELAASVISQCGVFARSTELLKNHLKPFIDSGQLEREIKLTRTGRLKNSFAPHDRVRRTF